ncbi:MAG TPA: SRPBCC family protein [Xanthobacteraceae bacterium]|nr:SRPBCC family protein [Xanthobacteraceae bacterium]
MRFLKRLAVGLVLLAAAAAVVVWLQPDDYRLTRSTVIAAPAETVFAKVNDLRRWDDWSPWAKLDPSAKITFEGPQAGVGASFKWDGNDKVGAGTMTITESKPNERVATRTDFVKPFEGSSRTDFIFSPAGNQTNVIWTMSGTHNFISKAICLVMNMEKMLGPDVERGLVQLKQVSEGK